MPVVSQQTLRAPFPWFGGKSAVADLIWLTAIPRISFSLSSHELAVGLSLFMVVTSCKRCGDVALFALRLAPIPGTFIQVETLKRFYLKAGFTRLCRDIWLVAIAVLCIFARSVPAKILRAIIRLVGIRVVTSVIAIRSRTGERQQNQSMHAHCLLASIHHERHSDVPRTAQVCFKFSRFSKAIRPYVIPALAATCPNCAIA